MKLTRFPLQLIFLPSIFSTVSGVCQMYFYPVQLSTYTGMNERESNGLKRNGFNFKWFKHSIQVTKRTIYLTLWDERNLTIQNKQNKNIYFSCITFNMNYKIKIKLQN